MEQETESDKKLLKFSAPIIGVLLVGMVVFTFSNAITLDFVTRHEYVFHIIMVAIFAAIAIMFACLERMYTPGGTFHRNLFFCKFTAVVMVLLLSGLFAYLFVLPQDGAFDENDDDTSEKQQAKKQVNKKRNLSIEGAGVRTKPPFPIDAVFTWAGEGFKDSDNIRVAYNEELKYSLRSVYFNLPWINHIYILMNPPKKKPSWFNDKFEKWVTILDQMETFPDKSDTPSTNSNAIEMTLHRIPNLSEHFIYFNDDTFVGKPLPYTYFFTNKGKPILSSKVKHKAKQNPEAVKANFPVPDMMNKVYLHIPFNAKKSEVEAFEKQYPEYVKWVRSQKKRKLIGCDLCVKMGLKCPCMQLQGTVGHYMYKRKSAALRNQREAFTCSSGYVNSSCPHKLDSVITPGVLDRLLAKQPPTFVIQDTAKEPKDRKAMRDKLKVFYKKMYPRKAPFEK